LLIVLAYSHSKLKVFEECALRFRYKYIDKIPEPQVPAKPACFSGTIVHAALELLYKKIQTSGSPLSQEELKRYLQSEMEKARDEHDRLSDTALLADQFDDYFQLGRQMIDRYYETYAPFTTGKVNGLEKMFSLELPNTQKLTGVIDRFDIDGDTAVIVDYKTDKDIKPYGEFSMSHEQQMTSYAAWIMANYPHVVKKIRGKLIYLRLGREIEREITPEAIQQAIQIITDKISVIEDTLFRYNMGEKEAF
jgi:RecB family exonuclease